MIRRFLKRIFPSKLEQRMDEELRFHLKEREEEFIKQGLPPEDARKAALREFGNVEALKEDCRDAWGIRALLNLIRDLRYTSRSISSTKGSSILVVVIMAFGIGVSMTMYSFVKGILWNDIGFADEDRIVSVYWDRNPNGTGEDRRAIRIDDYFDFVERNEALESLVAYRQNNPSFVFGGADAIPENHPAASVTPNFFDLLKIPAIHGRTFVPEDAGQHAVVLSYSFWQSRFDGDLDVIGSPGRIAGRPASIVGIMPPEYSGFPTNHEYWVAADFPNDWGPQNPRGQKRGLNVIGFLKEGISYQQAEANLETIASQLAEEYPNSNDDLREVRIRNYNEDILNEQNKNLLYLLLFCGAVVLFVASANVSNLMLARAARRSFELSIRNALGASKAHIMYQVVLEGFLLTLAGGAGGLFIAAYGSRYIWNTISDINAPFWWHVGIDFTSILVAIGAMAIASLAASFFPALRCARQDSFTMLRDDSRTSSSLFMGKLSKVLVGLQISLALALTIVAIVMASIQYAVISQKITYDPDKIVTASYWFGETNGFRQESDVDTLRRNVRESMLGLGAQGISYISGGGGLAGRNANRSFEKSGEQYEDVSEMPVAGTIGVSPDYFSIYGLNTEVTGRLFSATDTKESQPVAIVNRAFAQIHFPQSDPLGKHIRFPSGGMQDPSWLEIVGVVETYASEPLPGENLNDYAIIYRPFSQSFDPLPPGRMFFQSITITAKFRENSVQWMETLRREVAKHAPFATPRAFGSLREQQSLERRFTNLIVELFLAFGGISFLVASIGLYAVISFSAAQRIREFGVRMALGGQAKDIIYVVVRAGIIQSIAGLILGIILGQLLITQIAQAMNITGLPEIWKTSGAATILILATALFSMLVPAIKSTRINPVTALR